MPNRVLKVPGWRLDSLNALSATPQLEVNQVAIL